MAPLTALRAHPRWGGGVATVITVLCFSGCGAPDVAAPSGPALPVVDDEGSTTPMPAPPPPDPADSMAKECRDAGYTVCGFVTRDGEPMPGVIIEAKFGDQNQTTTTNDRGAYGLALQIPVVDLLCEETDEMLDAHLACQSAEEHGAPVIVESGESGRIVNFVIESL